MTGQFAREWRILQKILIAVAITAVMVVTSWQLFEPPAEVYVTVSAMVAGVFAIGGMRDPWFFLGVVVLVMVASPRVFDSSAHELFQACYPMGWLLGAIAGKVIRVARAGRCHSS